MKTGDSLYGQNQKPYVLEEELGSGGEGTVYKTSGGKLAAKIYKTPDAKTERKILSMLKLNIDMKSPGGIPLITWPKDILYQNGKFVGYVMPFAGGGKPIWNMGRPEGRNKIFGEENGKSKYNWANALAVATNIASLVSYLHSMGIIIGDMNSNNIFVHPNGYVTIMDADSFDIRDKETGEHFKCQVGRPEYLAPELQARRLSEESAEFTEQTDDFSLAVHIFQLLFCAHPFNMKMIDQKKDSKGENQQAEAIVEGNCPFVKPGYEHMIQPGVPHLSLLPNYLQDDFRETFSYNALNSVQRRFMRTKAVKWYQDLGRLYQEKDKELIRCTVNPEHYHLRTCSCELCRAKQEWDNYINGMKQWNIQTVCVNQNQTDVNTNLHSVSSGDKWYSHYRVNNSPMSMSIPLCVRRTYPNGDSTEIQKLPHPYKTGDWISIEGSTQKEEQKQAGLYKIELFDSKQNLLLSNSIQVTDPVPPVPPSPVPPPAPKKRLRGIIAAVAAFFAVIIGIGMFADRNTTPIPEPTQTAWSETRTLERTTEESQTTKEIRTAEETQTTEEIWAQTTQALILPSTELPSETERKTSFLTGNVDAGKIRIINYTGRNIIGLYISASSNDKWGANRLDKILPMDAWWEENLGYSSTWDLLVITADGSEWKFSGLSPNLTAYGSELVIIYQDRSVFAEVASNDYSWDGETILSEYITTIPPQTEASTTRAETQARSEYILPDSDKRYYTEAELSNLTVYELQIARNELYARHGRKFDNKALQAYFNSCSWYQGTIEVSEWTDSKENSIFNNYEKANRDLIVKLEGN